MDSNKAKIIDYAKTLYIKYNSEGEKVYSLRDIAKKILQKHNKKLTHTTVNEWSKKYDWDRINEKIKQQSIIKAKDNKLSTEEKIIEEESDKLAKDYKNAENLANVGYNIIMTAYKEKKEHPIISIKDALTAIKLGIDIKFRIMDIPDNKELGLIKIKFE